MIKKLKIDKDRCLTSKKRAESHRGVAEGPARNDTEGTDSYERGRFQSVHLNQGPGFFHVDADVLHTGTE